MAGKNILKQIFLNVGIGALAVVFYSPGLMNLRPTDVSILRAGSSICLGIAEAVAFFYGNYSLMKEPARIAYNRENVQDTAQALVLLNEYKDGRYFGSLARTAHDQIKRFEKSVERAKHEIGIKFDKGSMSYDKYDSVVSVANEALLSNIITMANRIQFFDESEYAKLQNYKNDDIPDDIQEKQIELYKKNMDMVKNAIRANENLILSIDSLSVELATSDKDEDNGLLEEIKKLTDEVKYYT